MSRIKIAFLLCCLLSLTSCSVGMAMSGERAPDLSQIRKGADRSDVELQLGSPVRTQINAQGGRTDIYEYEIGNEPSAGRAIGHGVMDVLTLGLWEVVGTPIEGFTGEKFELVVVYDDDDTVRDVRTRKIGGGM